MSILNFSVDIETISHKPHHFHLVANSEDRHVIARRLSLVSLEKLDAQLYLENGKEIYLTGEIVADVSQQCVRTLVYLPQHLEIKVDEIFLHKTETESEIDLEDLDSREPLQGNQLDLGEIVVQLLSLNLDPYPVAPDSKPIEYQEENGSRSPFDVLKKRK
ncbi:MAG: DUF177 domain-containing protein [Proteobacteria bacterium]|nr:DUF177 domain-containing protein [Pseudomonadota bacterium]